MSTTATHADRSAQTTAAPPDSPRPTRKRGNGPRPDRGASGWYAVVGSLAAIATWFLVTDVLLAIVRK